MKKIAIITPGRDCPGLNAFIRAVVRSGLHVYNLEVVGVESGFSGLVKEDFLALDNFSVSEIIFRGGTILKTSPDEPVDFTNANLQKIKNILAKHQIFGLIIAGGEGTLKIADVLAGAGIPVVFAPATIDNNVPETDFTLGFDSVLTNLVEIIDKIKDTASSNPRIFVIELAGDKVGFLTLFLGLTSGIEWLCLPGRPINLEELVAGIKKGMAEGKHHQLILTASTACAAENIASVLRQNISLVVKTIQLDDLERGGPPSARDVILASVFGAAAVEEIQKKSGIFLGFQKNQVVKLPLGPVARQVKHLPEKIIQLQKEISV